jgi:purine-cytosine permease-like protein
MMQGRIVDRAIWIRLAIAAALLGYIAIIFVSHFAPFPLFLGGLMAFLGWLLLPGLYLLARLRRIDMSRAAQPRVKDLLRPWVMTAGFGALAAVALFLALGWDVPGFCHGPSTAPRAISGRRMMAITTTRRRKERSQKSAGRHTSMKSA